MRTWLSIRVELIQGGGRTLWPRPGRVFAAARSYTFLQLGDAIDTAFARWDRAHLSLFELADTTDVCGPIQREDPPEGSGAYREFVRKTGIKGPRRRRSALSDCVVAVAQSRVVRGL